MKAIAARLPKELAETLKKAAQAKNITKCALLNFLITSFVNLHTSSGTLSPYLERLRIVLEREPEEGRHYDIKANCSTITTKVEESYYYLFEGIAEKQKVSKASLICELVSSVLKFMEVPYDEAGRNFTKEIESFKQKIKKNSEPLPKSKKSIRRNTEPSERCETAIYFLRDKNEKIFAIEVTEPPQEGEPLRLSYNAVGIFKRVIEACFPSVARRLKAVAEQTDTNSYIETIGSLLETEEAKADSRYIGSLFAENDKDERGRSLTPIKYKPLNRKNPYLASER